jgi:hypothetical protein
MYALANARPEARPEFRMLVQAAMRSSGLSSRSLHRSVSVGVWAKTVAGSKTNGSKINGRNVLRARENMASTFRSPAVDANDTDEFCRRDGGARSEPDCEADVGSCRTQARVVSPVTVLLRRAASKLPIGVARRAPSQPYTLRTSPSAHFTASSAGMPWTALANMSTIMYLESTSAAFGPAGPA